MEGSLFDIGEKVIVNSPIPKIGKVLDVRKQYKYFIYQLEIYDKVIDGFMEEELWIIDDKSYIETCYNKVKDMERNYRVKYHEKSDYLLMIKNDFEKYMNKEKKRKNK